MPEVRLLGQFGIQCDGKTVILSSRAAQSLFAYLILTGGILHPREKLAGMFWPNTTEEMGLNQVR
jgi:DNA-binding SARP family transcriptional activator